MFFEVKVIFAYNWFFITVKLQIKRKWRNTFDINIRDRKNESFQ